MLQGSNITSKQSGFVPSNNAMNLAQALGLFLSFFAHREGPGVKVPYPGPQVAYTALHTDVSQSLLARFHIYASLHPDLTARQSFNIGDDPSGVSWMAVWPRICAHFGLVGTGPTERTHPKNSSTLTCTCKRIARNGRLGWPSTG